MRLVVSWLRDFVDVPASPEEIAEGMALRGFEVASIEPLEGGDAVIDFEVTANRPDCLSVLGLAREVATLYDRPLTAPSASPGATIALKSIATGTSDRLAVTIESPELCPRYAAAVAEVTVGESPAWLTHRLQAAGVRPINSIVDVTNYVLLELGHPTHAFDLARLAGDEIRVRVAKRHEVLKTLDNVERTLDADMLVIADRDRAQAVAGVMGGAAAEVSPQTKLVAFESAYFKPASVRRTSKRLGLKTEASSRFERGTDINAPVWVLERIIALLEQIGAGRSIAPIIDVYPSPRQPAHLHLRRARLAALLGVRVPEADVERILRGLGLTVAAAGDGWDVIAPTVRVDLVHEVDLIEEVGRHHGFDKLEASFPVVTTPAPPPDPRIARDRTIRTVLTAAGLSEAVTFGMIETKASDAFPPETPSDLIRIENPLSASFDVMRVSLLPGLVDAVARNRRHGRRDVGLFEIGARFSASKGETRGAAVAWTGAAGAEHWSVRSRDVGFFDVKGVVEQLCAVLRVSPRFEPTTSSFLVAGQAAAVVANGVRFGILGLVAPSVVDGRGAPRQDAVFVAEIDLDAVSALGAEPRDAVHPLPRHPFVVRDLSMVVDDALPAEIIRGTIQAAGASAPAPMVSVRVFDRYEGKGVPNGRVSLSVRLTFQSADRTLTDAEVQASVEAILTALVREHGAVQR
jgi:phenylalanyl-tRNA synthetase beta chain